MKKYYKFIIILLVISFIIPQVALASWWNPFSWNIWNKIFSIFYKSQNVSPVSSDNTIVINTNTDKNEREEVKQGEEQTGEQNVKSDTEKPKQGPVTDIEEENVYRTTGINSISTIIEKYKLEQNFCNGMVDFANLRISNREKLKTNATNTLSAIDSEMVYIMNGWYDMEIKYAQEIRNEFISENNNIQKNINSLQNLSNAIATSKETVDNNLFVESIKKPIDTHIKAVELVWEYLDKLAVTFKKEVDSQDSEFSGNILPRLIASMPSATTTYQPSTTYEIHYTPLQYNFLNDVYKRQQLEALQNINDNLLRIANNY